MIALFAEGRPDFVASDPLWYASIARQLETAPKSLFALHDLHPFVMRLGLTTPLAVLYRLFGVSDVTTNLPALLAALTILIVVYTTASTPRAKLVALGIGVFSTALIQNALILNVDLPCAALMAVSIACLTRNDGPRGAWWLVGTVVAGFAAFMVKEVAVWCVPVWIYAAAVDLRARSWRAWIARYAPAVATGVALGGAYLGFCAVMWDDPLARFHGIDALTYEHTWALHGQTAHAWIARLTWQPPVMFAKLVQFTLVPALLSPWLVRGRDRIWCVAASTFVLLFWFGSSSLSAYAPLPLSPRMALPALPPLLVCAALAFDRLIDHAAGSRWRVAAVILLGVVIAVPPLRAGMTVLRRVRPEKTAFDELRREAATTQPLMIVCAEPRCVAIGGYYFGFDPPPNVQVVFAGDFAAGPAPTGARVRALVNTARSHGFAKTDPNSDRADAITALGLPQLAGDHNIQLLDAGDGTRLWSALR